MKCEHCGSDDLVYLGVSDGYGNYGNLCCDVYRCERCNEHTVDNCFNCEDDEQFGSHEHQLEEANKK